MEAMEFESGAGIGQSIELLETAVLDAIRTLTRKINTKWEKVLKHEADFSQREDESSSYKDALLHLTEINTHCNKRLQASTERIDCLKRGNEDKKKVISDKRKDRRKIAQKEEKLRQKTSKTLVFYNEKWLERYETRYSKLPQVQKNEKAEKECSDIMQELKAKKSELRQCQANIFKAKCERNRRNFEESSFYPLENFMVQLAKSFLEIREIQKEIEENSDELLDLENAMKERKNILLRQEAARRQLKQSLAEETTSKMRKCGNLEKNVSKQIQKGMNNRPLPSADLHDTMETGSQNECPSVNATEESITLGASKRVLSPQKYSNETARIRNVQKLFGRFEIYMPTFSSISLVTPTLSSCETLNASNTESSMPTLLRESTRNSFSYDEANVRQIEYSPLREQEKDWKHIVKDRTTTGLETGVVQPREKRKSSEFKCNKNFPAETKTEKSSDNYRAKYFRPSGEFASESATRRNIFEQSSTNDARKNVMTSESLKAKSSDNSNILEWEDVSQSNVLKTSNQKPSVSNKISTNENDESQLKETSESKAMETSEGDNIKTDLIKGTSEEFENMQTVAMVCEQNKKTNNLPERYFDDVSNNLVDLERDFNIITLTTEVREDAHTSVSQNVVSQATLVTEEEIEKPRCVTSFEMSSKQGNAAQCSTLTSAELPLGNLSAVSKLSQSETVISNESEPKISPNSEDMNLSLQSSGSDPENSAQMVSPFDFEKHLEVLQEMKKSPGFTFTTRHMYKKSDIEDEKESNKVLAQSSMGNTALMEKNFMDDVKSPVSNEPSDKNSDDGERFLTSVYDDYLLDSPPTTLKPGTEKSMFSFQQDSPKSDEAQGDFFPLFAAVDSDSKKNPEEEKSEFVLNFGGASTTKSPEDDSAPFKFLF